MRDGTRLSRRLCRWSLWCALVGAALAETPAASAQVVIDMPAPRKQPPSNATSVVIQPPPAAPVAAAAVASPRAAAAASAMARLDVGDIALNRYARARTGTYDTYQVGGVRRYAGYRYYGDLWWWHGFGFPHCGHFGNRFVGFVGRGHAHCKH